MRELNTKKKIFPITSGETEYQYISKLILSHWDDLFSVSEKIPFQQLESPKKAAVSKLDKLYSGIAPRVAGSSRSDDIVMIITDKDSSDYSDIDNFAQKFYSDSSINSDRKFFILNVSAIEDWLKYYYTAPSSINKAQMAKDINNNWDSIFNNKHTSAINYYEKINNSDYAYSEENSYSETILESPKDYSDFPKFINFLQQCRNESLQTPIK